MDTYPVHAPRDPYRGHDARKCAKRTEFNRVAARVEDHINADLRDKPAGVYTFLTHSIARKLGEDENLVQRIVFGIDCGHNGVTIMKGDGGEDWKRINGLD